MPHSSDRIFPLELSHRRAWAAEQSISFLMQQAVENRDVISLAAGLVDESTLPVRLVREAFDVILSDEANGQNALQYGTTAGHERLRDCLLQHLATLEGLSPNALGVSADELLVTAGSQQLLNHVADVLLDPGDICLVAGPTYFVFLGTLNGVGARTLAIPADEYGMRMDCLEAELARLAESGELSRVKLIYLVSYFENPSGTSLATERRQQVVEIARRWSQNHRLMILEDAAYRELQYSGETLPSVWSYDASRSHVILANTFSKSFSPGVRVGYGVLPRDLVSAVHDVKGNLDFGSPNLNQAMLAEVLASQRYAGHVSSLRAAYREKRDAMLAAIKREFADLPGVSWLVPDGGLYVWMRLPDGMQTGYESPLWKHATHIEKVMYVPGEIFYPADSPIRRTSEMRLSFGVETPQTITEGICRLATAVRAIRES